MSLDAIAALLGHKTLTMTLVYARIADRTVADEYFAVTEKVEALYDQPRRTARRRRRPPRCANSAPRCTAACSATATAPDRSNWTATSNRSANPAPSSSPPSSSGPPCKRNATTPPTRAKSAARRSSTDSSTDSTHTGLLTPIDFEVAVVDGDGEVAPDVVEPGGGDVAGERFRWCFGVEGSRVDQLQCGALVVEILRECHGEPPCGGVWVRRDQKSESRKVGSRPSLKAPIPSTRSGWTAERQCASIMIAIACSIGWPWPS